MRQAVRDERPVDMTLEDARGLLAQGEIDVKEFERIKSIILQRQREQAGLGTDGSAPHVKAEEEEDARKDSHSDIHPASPDS